MALKIPDKLNLTSQSQNLSPIPDVDIFIGNHTVIDPDIFTLWIEGVSVQDATESVQRRGGYEITKKGISADMMAADLLDHYRTYTALEKLLHSPILLHEQYTFQLHPGVEQTILNRYYNFDHAVMREILGKKLSSRQRKDLDEVSEKTGVNLRSCRRQFDNVKRVFKIVEEMNGSVLQNIMSYFLLTDELARKYCAIIFITGNRFETNKRKLQYLTYTDFYNCAHSMMSHWASPILDEENTSDMEREFFMDLREFRVLLDKEKEHKMLVCKGLKGKVADKIYNEVEHNFKAYSRTLINIAYGLNHNKELKDLFVDLVEKFIDPCKHLHWPVSDLKTFLQIYAESALQLDVIKSQPTVKSVWKRYMDGISGCIMAMYHT